LGLKNLNRSKRKSHHEEHEEHEEKTEGRHRGNGNLELRKSGKDGKTLKYGKSATEGFGREYHDGLALKMRANVNAKTRRRKDAIGWDLRI
jgi:hypothetical protein